MCSTYQEGNNTEDCRPEEALDSDTLSNISSLSPSSVRYQNCIVEAETESVTSSECKLARRRHLKIKRAGRDQFWSIGLDSLPFDPKPKISLSHPGTKLYDEPSDDVHLFYVEAESSPNRLDRSKRFYFVRWPEAGDRYLFMEEQRGDQRMFWNGRHENRRFLFKHSEKIGGFLLESTDRTRFVGVDRDEGFLVAVNDRENAVNWTIPHINIH